MTSYLIKSILCSGILILVYHLFLEREKMPRFNRFYLLSALIFSLSVPLISFEITPETALEPIVAAIPDAVEQMQTTAVVSSVTTPSDSNLQSDLTPYLLFLFVGICCLLLARFVVNIRSILKLKSQCRTIPVVLIILSPRKD